MRKLVKNIHTVVGFSPAALSSVTVDTVSLKNYQHLTIKIAVTKGTGTETAAVTLKQATDVSGTSAKTLGFDYVWKVADIASSDVPVKTAVSSDTFDIGGVADKNSLYQIEIDTDELDVENGFDCVYATVADLTTGTGCVIYELSQPRHIDETHKTAITD